MSYFLGKNRCQRTPAEIDNMLMMPAPMWATTTSGQLTWPRRLEVIGVAAAGLSYESLKVERARV